VICIATDIRGTRTYSIPPELLDVAKRVFPDKGEEEAIFALASRLTADRFATVAHIAVQDVEQAAGRASEWIDQRRFPASKYVT